MLRLRILAMAVAFIFLASVAIAAEPAHPLLTATGTVDKVGKDTLTIRPRSREGRFEKSLVLKITGTSNVSTLSFQTRAGRLVPVQNSTDAKDLETNQSIALIYTVGPSGPVLLAAVVQPAQGR